MHIVTTVTSDVHVGINVKTNKVVGLPSRPEPIMLLNFPIMLLSNAPNFSQLCSTVRAQLCSIMLHKLLLACYLSLKINLFL